MKQLTVQSFNFTIPGSVTDGVWRPESAGYGSAVLSGTKFVLVGYSEQSTLEYINKQGLGPETRVARIEHNFKTVGMVHFFITKGTKESRQRFFEEQRQLQLEMADQEGQVEMFAERMDIGRAEILIKGYEPIKGKLSLRCSRNGNPTYSFSRDRFVPKLVGQVDLF